MAKVLNCLLNRSRLSVFATALVALLGFAGQAHSQCGSPQNAIVAENCLTGNDSSEWDVKTGDAGDPSIQGFASDISVNQGGTINFKINTNAKSYTINIYRMGYYGGLGARKVATVTPSAPLPQIQPACFTDNATGLIDCGNWGVSASWKTPANAVSGIYFAHLVRSDTGGDSHIVFIVRNDSSHSAILFQTSDETWQAYNYYGNGSLYGPAQPSFDLTNRSYKVSYNRPFMTRGTYPESNTWVFGAEFPMLQWLEQNGYDVTYFTGVDAARSGSLIQSHKIYMDSGHDEYWDTVQRASVQSARDAGVNLAFFAGNEMFWKTRWENSFDGTNTPNRTLVCYKETLAFAKIDPSDPPTWTGTWRDPSFSPPADGGKPENALTGTLFMINGPGPDNDGSLTIKVPSDDGQMRFWRNTAAATLAAGKSYTLTTGSLGYEWDLDVDNGFRPAGAFHLSTSTYPMTSDYLLDYGGTYGAGSATHHMMLYRAPSHALVFSSGTVNWSWGLNNSHDNPFGFTTPVPDPNMQQATVNLFADMGVQPATLQSGLIPASASTDTTAPASLITSPSAGANLNTGSAITVTGTATDVGGVVAGVELSTDGGVTWHPATGRSKWSYAWTPTTVGTLNLLSRAVDDSGNLEVPTNGIQVNVAPQVCPCSIWNSSSAPATVDAGDPSGVELGLKFRADSDGSVLGVRFYKATANTGTHVGHVWSSTGALLGTATFTGETTSGWQHVSFSTPIPVQANTTYVVSYFAPVGHYSADQSYFAQSGIDNPPLHALANGVDGANGVFVYTSTGGFPNSGSLSSNYWVDVVYTSSNTYHATGLINGYGGAGATVSLNGTETSSTTADGSGNYRFDGLINGTYTITPTNPGVTFTPSSQTITINGAVVSNVNFTAVVTSPQSISGNVAGASTATVNLGGAVTASTTVDASGNYSFTGLLSGSYSVTPDALGVLFTPGTQSVTLSGAGASGINFQGQLCNCVTIWQPSAVPAVVDSNDSTPVELGVKFRVDTPGFVTGVRFYKASTNTGSHIGQIWSSAGALLGSATFNAETASGWQQVTFSSPIFIAANTTYVASYFAPVGRYSVNTSYFAASGVDSPPLHALAEGVDGSNGVFLYTTNPSFPTNSFQSANYWVDVLFSPSQSYAVSGTIQGGAGATVTLSSGTSSVTTIADGSGNYAFSSVFSGSYSVTPTLSGLIFVPGNQNVTVGSASLTGINFTIPQMCPCNTIWQPSTQPTVSDSADAHSVELGVKFHADTDGYILGVRFYKAATNTGVHIGNLWSNAGTGRLLSTGGFTNESASGWQQVLFPSPVAVSANTTYVASYFAPSGHYSADTSYLATAGVNSPPLHALQDGVDGGNGVFAYASSSTFPNGSFSANNYWVDVIYAKTSTHTLGGSITGPGSAGATVTLSGAAAATTTSDSNGNYSISGLVDGTYVVTPSLTGVSFIPASQTIAISGGHQLAVNFASAVPTYSLAGTVTGAPGVTVSLTGASTATATTDSLGNYNFAALANGSYVVTPSGPGYSFTPASQSVIVNGAGVSGVNFTATVVPFSISGMITGGAGATVSMTGTATATTVADASGNYNFPGLAGGSYTITPALVGSVFVRPSLTVSLTGANITGANFAVPVNCPCNTLWQPSNVPGNLDNGDNNSIEVGVKFRVDSNGFVSGIRFYKASLNIGPHIGNLWSSTGTLLATATFVNEGASGWQQVLFNNPVAVTSNTTYIASYFAPSGNYSDDGNFFGSSGVDSGPVHALATGVDGLNGVFLYGAVSGFPTNSFNASNYWVDVIFTATTSYSLSGTIAGASGVGATVNLTGAAAATTTANSSGAYIFTGLANGSYTVTPTNGAFAFTPPNQVVTVNGANATANFGSVTYSISGSISGAGGAGATVSLSGAATATTTADASGAYIFSGLGNGSYTVTPTSTGFVFTPTSQAVTVNGANATANFGGVTFSISGTITGTGGSGATVSLSGAATATTTADPSGAYTFSGLANGSYTVAPSKAGFSFTPASAAVTVSGANSTANFASTAQTFTISGTISGTGGSGATVSLGGAATASTTANTSGVYTFSGLVNGAYTVTPSKTGFSFTPASAAVTVSGANATVNFTSIAQTFTISGTISGTGGSGATVSLGGAATASTTANTSGVYTFSGLVNGAYTVTPSKTGFSFTPAIAAVTVSGANATANFASVAQTFTISGTISGAGGNAATVRLTGAVTATVTASASGAYTFSGLANGAYTVTPSRTGFTFTPASQAVTVSGANVTVNFATVTFAISGTISGTGGNAATVRLTGAATATVTASSTGAYTFSGLTNGAYTVTPSKTGFTFTPASAAVTLNGANATANFATVTFTISGTISGAGGNGSTVKLTGAATATVTASATGAYTFSGLANGSYTVTPSRTGFTFTPASSAVTLSGANATANFATVTLAISGTISGTGGNAATVRLTGAATATVTASSTGAYTFSGVTNGSYTVTPSKTGFTFTPASSTVTVSGANATANFTSAVQTSSISGTISGGGGSGATVQLTGAATATVTANASGAYSFLGLANGSYTVTPTKSGHLMIPTSRTTTVSSANVTGLNFTSF